MEFDEPPSYVVCPLSWNKDNRGHLGSFYTHICEVLLSRPEWKNIGVKRLAAGWNKFGRFHLLLAEAQARGTNYAKLSSLSSMYPRILTNYSRGFDNICRKAKMVHTLRDYFENTLRQKDRAAWFMPETYTLYPSRPELCEKAVFLDRFAQGEEAEARERSTDRDALSSSSTNLWILKPSDGLKGSRISVIGDRTALLRHLDETVAPDSVAWVAQVRA